MGKIQNILCMRWGDWPVADVNNLYRAVMRNTKRKTNFYVLTDDAQGLLPGIIALPIPEISFWDMTGMHGGQGWRKLAMWSKDIGFTGETLYLDLDVVVLGSIDDFFDFKPGEFCIIRNWTEKLSRIGNSSIVKFMAGKAEHILDKFSRDPVANSFAFGNEQIFVTKNFDGKINFWPKRWCPSFKKTLLPLWPLRLIMDVPLPKDARMVVFTGSPRPADALKGRWPIFKWRNKYIHKIRPVRWLSGYGWD